jgi:multiple sugar transport system permease protein
MGEAVNNTGPGRLRTFLKFSRNRPLLGTGGPKRGEARAALALLAISLIPLVLFSIVPTINSFRYAFTDFSMFADRANWVGLANFREAAADDRFWQMWRNTFAYAGMTVPVQMLLGLFVALLLDRRFPGVSVLRTAFYLPTLTSAVAVGYIFKSLFHPSYGFLNSALKHYGLPTLYWLDDPSTALPSLALVGVWLGFGTSMIVFLAGLQGIPGEYYEAASIDGANSWQKIRYITIPLLRPVTFYLFVTGLISALQVYDTIMVMTYDPRGGPLGSTTTIVFSIYQNATLYNRMGYASALSVMLFGVIFVLTWINFRIGGESIRY